MPVVGMSIRKIEAIREMERATGEVKINSNTNLKKVTEMDIGSLKEKGLSIDFEHVINYVATEGELAKINISGMVLYYDKNQDELLKHWEEKKRAGVICLVRTKSDSWHHGVFAWAWCGHCALCSYL